MIFTPLLLTVFFKCLNKFCNTSQAIFTTAVFVHFQHPDKLHDFAARLVVAVASHLKKVQTRLKLFKIVQNCSKSFKIVENCFKLFKIIQNRSKLNRQNGGCT